MKKVLKVLFAATLIGLSTFVYASSKKSGTKVECADFKEVLEKASITEIKTGSKPIKGALTNKSSVIHDVALDEMLPFDVYKVQLEENKKYNLTLKSIPEGLFSTDWREKKYMAPEVFLFDENLNFVNNRKYDAYAFMDKLYGVLKVTTLWNIEKSGTYYFVVKSDMSVNDPLVFQGVTAYGDAVVTEFQRIKTGKYIFEIETEGEETGKKSKKTDLYSEGLTYATNRIENANPEKGETWFTDIELDAEKKYSASPFYAADLMLYIDEKLNLSAVMNDEQKVQLAQALFKDLPDVNDRYVRTVVVGNVFSDEGVLSNLAFLVSKVQLKQGSVPGADYAYHFISNAILLTDKKTGEDKKMCTRTTFTEINFYFVAVPFENGMLVRAGNLNLGKENYKDDLSLMDKGNLMDTFVRDEIPENDAEIEKLYKEITSSADGEAAVKKVLAPLNYGLYLAKQGKIAEAEKLWKSIDVTKLKAETEFDKNFVESSKTVFDRDIPCYLNIVKNF